MSRVKEAAYTAACLVWFFVLTIPAWLLYIASLGAVTLEFFAPPQRNWIEITIPGWSQNTFSYGVPRWRPF